MSRESWRAVTARHRTPSDARAWLEVLACVVPLVALWLLLVASLQLPYIATLVLAAVASLFFTRLFLLQHDMGHGALFKTPWLNDVVGIIVCVPLLTPYWEWRKSHAIHHSHAGKLETRIVPDILTMTVDEWRTAPLWKRAAYRVFRSVPFLFGVAPLWHFLVSNRIKGSMCRELPRGKNLLNVWITTAGFALFAWAVSSVIGFGSFLAIQAPIIVIGGMFGMWIFYLEHNFETTWLAREGAWSHEDASLRGSSFCPMPRWLAWLVADVGYHHVHHLDPKVPSYRLRACHDDNPELFGRVPRLSIRESLRGAWSLRVYDEEHGRLVPFP